MLRMFEVVIGTHVPESRHLRWWRLSNQLARFCVNEAILVGLVARIPEKRKRSDPRNPSPAWAKYDDVQMRYRVRPWDRSTRTRAARAPDVRSPYTVERCAWAKGRCHNCLTQAARRCIHSS